MVGWYEYWGSHIHSLEALRVMHMERRFVLWAYNLQPLLPESQAA